MMDKSETQAALGQTHNGQARHRQYWDKTHNEHTRATGIIGTRHIMDKSETEEILRQDTQWTNQ
jgi:hypothetical protein